MKYNEVFKEPGTASGGIASVFGKIDYSFSNTLGSSILRFFQRKKFNPLEVNKFSSFPGVLFFLSRNDLDIKETRWQEMIIDKYQLLHYKDAHRFKLYNPKKGDTYLQIPPELILINVDKVPDPILSGEIDF